MSVLSLPQQHNGLLTWGAYSCTARYCILTPGDKFVVLQEVQCVSAESATATQQSSHLGCELMHCQKPEFAPQMRSALCCRRCSVSVLSLPQQHNGLLTWGAYSCTARYCILTPGDKFVVLQEVQCVSAESLTATQ